MLIAEQGTGVRTVTAGNIRRGGELVSDRSGSGRNRWLRAGTTASLIYFMANKANGRVHVLEAGAARPRQFRTGELTGLTPVIFAPLVGQLRADGPCRTGADHSGLFAGPVGLCRGARDWGDAADRDPLSGASGGTGGDRGAR